MLSRCRHFFSSSPHQAPGPGLFTARLETFEDNFHAHLHYPLQLLHRYGEVVALPDWHQTHLINAPELISLILQNKNNYFAKNNRFYQSLTKLLGKGLLTAEDQQWKISRQHFQRAFHKHLFNDYIPILSSNTKKILLTWEKEPKKKINITRTLFELTFNNALNALMNYSSPLPIKNVWQKINQLNQDMSYGPTKWIPSWKHLRIAYNKKKLNQLIQLIIHQPPPKNNDTAGLMSTFFQCYPNLNKPQIYQRAFSDIKTLLISSYETTGCLLNWCFYCLALCQDKQKKLREEINLVCKNTDYPDLNTLDQCHYLTAVIKEVLRLYPPIWHTWRKIKTELYFGRYLIPKNSHLLINFYVLHRHPLYWDNPNVFLPERFLTSKKQPRFTYLPFGLGEHQCLASQFALFEAKLILSQCIKKYHFSLPNPINLRPNPKITLHPNHDLHLSYCSTHAVKDTS